MICIFKNTAKKKQLIETNGEYILDNICTYGIITEGLNDEFTLEIDFEILTPVKKELYDLITEEGILKVEDEYGDEFFVISEIYKTSDSIRAIARQITIAETLDLFLEDVRPEKQNGAGALTHIFSNTTCTHEIVVNSDIQTISTAYYNRKTVYEALHDSDMAFQERWGGEVYRRQFNLHINNKVGSYRGVKIKSNKNLTGFEENTTKDTVCTRIYPKGFNGITIEEKYIDSENIGMYKRPISRAYTFEDVKVRDENTGEDEEVFETLEEAQEELKKRSKALFEEDKVDFIKAYYTINHVDLRSTEEYKNYSATEMTCIGDEVDVEEETLGIDIRTRVVKRKYNILTKEREETELSNVGLKRVITLPDLEKEFEKIPSTESFLEAAKEIATGLINAGIKNSHVVVRKNEILIMDTDDINTAQKVWRFNVNGLGYSSTGYYGEFGLAMTMDGSIVADFINVGILNANLIKAGVIKSLNEKTWINMEDGSFNLADALKFIDGKLSLIHTNGTEGITLDKGGIKITTYSESNGMEDVAKIIATSFSKDRNQNGLSICTTGYGDYIQIGYQKEDGTIRAATYFVPVSIPSAAGLPFSDAGIYIYDPIFLKNSLNIKGSDVDHQLVNLSGNYLGIYGDNGLEFGYKSGTALKTRLKIHESPPSGTGDLFESYGNWNFKGYTLHNINIQNSNLTNNYANLDSRSAASVTALESCEEDTIRYIYKDIRSIGNKIILNIPNKYKGCNYTIVGIAKKGFGDYAIAKEEATRFIIETDREMEMNIEISIDTSYLKKDD